MKQSWQLIRYFYTWQATIPIAAVLGVFLFVLKTVFTNTSPQVTFVLGLSSFAFLFVIPFCSSSTALRHLAANAQTSMVPGLKLQAGFAHLLIAVAASVYLYVNFLVFAPDDYSPLVMIRTFVCFSAYAGFMQLILPSRYFITIISLAPFALVMITVEFRELSATLFLDANITLALLAVALTGWAFGLHTLARGERFRPASTALNCSEAWATYDGGFLTRQAIGEPRSAAGTLLLGYPDSWSGIIFRVFYYYLITPMFTTVALYIIGFGEQWEMSTLETVSRTFLLFSLFSAVYCIFIYGELVARARLVWLRFGTDRKAQWQLVERYCLRFLFVYYFCALVITGICLIVTNVPANFLAHYLLIVISYCFFNLYLALLLRANNQHWIVTLLIVLVTLTALAIGIGKLVSDTAPDASTLIVVETLFLLLGFAFRAVTRNTFLGIDWKQVVIAPRPGKYVLTGK